MTHVETPKSAAIRGSENRQHASSADASTLRVLHLIDTALDSGSGSAAEPCVMRLAAQVLQHSGIAHSQAVVLGSEASRDFARRVCGLNSMASVNPASAWPFAGRRELKRAVSGLEAGNPGCDGGTARFGVVHAWTERAAALASLAWPERPCVFTPQVGPSSGAFVRAIATKARSPLRIVAATREIADAYIGWHIPESLVCVEMPGVESSELQRGDRERIRQRWSEQSPLKASTFVIGLLCEPTAWSDARTASSVAARVAVSGRDVRLVLHSRAARRMRGMRVASDLGQHNLLIVDDEISQPWKILGGLDAGLVATCDADAMRVHRQDVITSLFSLGRRVGERCLTTPLPLLWALAAGLPVVVEKCESNRELLSDERHQSHLIERGDVNSAADRFVRLCDARNHHLAPSQSRKVRDYCELLELVYSELGSGRARQPIDTKDLWR